MTIAEFIYTVLLRPRPLRRAANATIRALLPERIRVGEATVWLNPDDPVISGALTLGVYERRENMGHRSRCGRSKTFTRWPACSSACARCEPMNPAPPQHQTRCHRFPLIWLLEVY